MVEPPISKSFKHYWNLLTVLVRFSYVADQGRFGRGDWCWGSQYRKEGRN